MSQIEQEFRQLLAAKPEIEKCYIEGLINRRALARYLIKKGITEKNQMDATVAMLRRYEFSEDKKQQKECLDLFKNTRITVKDKIAILEFKKDKTLMQKLQKIISHTDYDKGETLKIVIGTQNITLFIDQKKVEQLKGVLEDFTLIDTMKNMSEISIIFPEETKKIKGTLSLVTKEFVLNNITISECLTASLELLIYVKEESVLKAYEILRRLQQA